AAGQQFTAPAQRLGLLQENLVDTNGGYAHSKMLSQPAGLGAQRREMRCHFVWRYVSSHRKTGPSAVASIWTTAQRNSRAEGPSSASRRFSSSTAGVALFSRSDHPLRRRLKLS